MAGGATSSASPIPQSSVVPFRRDDDGIRICLITSQRKQRWIFPKITARDQLDGIDAAENAAIIEAGVHGKVTGEPVGTYKLLKNGDLHLVTVYILAVERSEEEWCEADHRLRKWATVEEAKKLIVKQELQYMLKRALMRIAREELDVSGGPGTNQTILVRRHRWV